MRVLGIDLGKKRIGLAISDEDASFAFPGKMLLSAGRKADIQAIAELIREQQIGRVVVGLPRHLDGRTGSEAENAERFSRSLASLSGVPVDTLDERWTTLEAERALRAVGHKGKKLKQRVDSAAAAIILRTYLELKGSELRGARLNGEETKDEELADSDRQGARAQPSPRRPE